MTQNKREKCHKNKDCCGLGSRVGTRPPPTKTPEIIGDSVGASLVASVSTNEEGAA
jgi:hypothetical protein